ncbi:MAG: 6-bladed beta-propeller [Bacteroidales bacterium]|nr:6-bladed beta-propeller [Bacteroidales bacterium]
MKKLIYIVFAFLFAGCTSKQFSHETHVSSGFYSFDLNDEIDNSYYLQSDIYDSISLVFLETDENSLVHSPIMNIVASDTRYYIEDSYLGGGLIIFDKDGKFIKRISKGQGPGEILGLHGFSFDHFTNRLLIVFNPYMYVFDEDGKYECSYKLPFPATTVMATENGYIFGKGPGHKSEIDDFDDYSLVVTDKEFNVLGLCLKYESRRAYAPKMISNGNQIYISLADKDTIYQWTDDKLTAVCSFDFSSVKTDFPDDETQDYMHNYKMDVYSYDGTYTETARHQIIVFTTPKGVCTLFRDKETEVIKGGLYALFERDKEISISIPKSTYGNKFISYIQPLSYVKGSINPDASSLSHEDCMHLEDLDMEDNPFLAIYTLKEFDDED